MGIRFIEMLKVPVPPRISCFLSLIFNPRLLVALKNLASFPDAPRTGDLCLEWLAVGAKEAEPRAATFLILRR
jgi:hypothetical protein